MVTTLTAIGVIPARYASQRLPAKPLVDLLGKPMIQRVYEQAGKARTLGRIIVATDDERIASVVRGFSGEVVMTPPELRSGSDRVAAVAADLHADLVVNIQGDEPLLVPEMVDQAVHTLVNDPGASVGTLGKTIARLDELQNPGVVKVVVDRRSRALYFSRSVIPFVRDGADPRSWLQRHRFLKHIGLYVFRREALLKYAQAEESPLERAEKLEQLRALEQGLLIAVGLTEHDTVPVDTTEDAERVREILRASQENGE